ncbi:E3 ubiquitin-protein ligase synoviolin-like [Balamuthia mandrillaris]
MEKRHAGKGFACPICLCNVRANSNASYITDCQHSFCVECITRHLKQRRECPLCRRPVKIIRLDKEGKDETASDTSTVVCIGLRYGRQLFEVEIARNANHTQFKKVVCQFFGLLDKRVKIVHKGELITKENYQAARLLLPNATFQVIGTTECPNPSNKWDKPPSRYESDDEEGGGRSSSTCGAPVLCGLM